jgi:signal transduction histidine kinase
MIELNKVPPALLPHVLGRNLQELGPLRKLYGHFLDAVRQRLEAEAAWLLVMGCEQVEARVVRGRSELFDEEAALAFFHDREPPPSPTVALARIRVHGRLVAVAGAARPGRPLGQPARRSLDRLAGVLSAELSRRDDAVLAKVLDRIRGKIVSELRPRDLAYQILDGLHQLVDYDHSAAVLTFDPAAQALRVEAEKIVWTKAKSAFVGCEIPFTLDQVAALSDGPEIRDPAAGGLFSVLDYHRGDAIPAVSSLLSAPLYFGGELLGLLKIAGWKRRPFDGRDLSVMKRFLPAAQVAIRNARLNRSLTKQAIEAERKATLVTLASAVAHDVNNAVGSILPLTQQMRAELRQPGLCLDTLEQDLAVIEEKARLCQRIFTNMLRAARSGRSGDGPVDLNQLVRETLPFMQGGAGRQGVEIVLDLDPALPAVRFSRNDLQHVVLNLASNSLEAMARKGSRITVSTRLEAGGRALLTVADDGPGIALELLDRVEEPFFTTKAEGVGLGLTIVRSLAWQNDGSLDVASAPGEGTRVEVGLRLANPPSAEAPVERP